MHVIIRQFTNCVTYPIVGITYCGSEALLAGHVPVPGNKDHAQKERGPLNIVLTPQFNNI
jgi:hypothetical protein